MKFEYQIQEQDYLDFQLYTASKSPRFEKKQRNGRYFITLCSLITACYFTYVQDWGMVAYFGLTTVCLLYTSDAADDMQCVELGGRRIMKKRKV